MPQNACLVLQQKLTVVKVSDILLSDASVLTSIYTELRFSAGFRPNTRPNLPRSLLRSPRPIARFIRVGIGKEGERDGMDAKRRRERGGSRGPSTLKS